LFGKGHECLLDLEKGKLLYVIRDHDGTTYASTIAEATTKESAGLELQKIKDLPRIFPDVEIRTVSPIRPRVNGQWAQVQTNDWTRNDGLFIGTLGF
jgi:hypothetical protein